MCVHLYKKPSHSTRYAHNIKEDTPHPRFITCEAVFSHVSCLSNMYLAPCTRVVLCGRVVFATMPQANIRNDVVNKVHSLHPLNLYL